MNNNGLPYEVAAYQTTVAGWVCKTCNRFWADDEHMARWCCAKDIPCDCGGRIKGSWTKCQSCRDQSDKAKWQAQVPIDWDGEYPISIADNDKYLWDADAVYEYIDDHECDPLSIRWTTCDQQSVRHFEMNDYLSDELHEDDDTDFSEINALVNDWIENNVPKLWYPTQKRISEKSLLENLPDLLRKEPHAQEQ